MSEQENMKEFLAELTKLAIKHNLVIDGCGCCGSPWVNPQNGAAANGQYSEAGGELCWNQKVESSGE